MQTLCGRCLAWTSRHIACKILIGLPTDVEVAEDRSHASIIVVSILQSKSSTTHALRRLVHEKGGECKSMDDCQPRRCFLGEQALLG